MLIALCITACAQADPLEDAKQAMEAGDHAKAAAAYRAAAEQRPDLPELIFNEGVALYRQKEYAQAAEAFSRALASGRSSLEGPTKFNLGNCAYSMALEQADQPPKAIEQLKQAMRYYRDALAANPRDADARANIELAARLLKTLEEQKQEQQPSSQPNEDEQQDDKKNPSSQPDKNKKGKPSTQPSDDEQKQGEQSASQPEQEQPPSTQPQSSPQSQPSAQSQPAEQEQAAQMREMTKQEAERLLQQIRDKQRQRREAQLRQQKVRRVPVEKDW